MKKTLILAALVLISAGGYAQKNPLVKKAKSYAMASEKPDFTAARAAIQEALASAPTTETYYWAGMIGYQEVSQQNYNQQTAQGYDAAKAGAAVMESYDYWLKADELAMIPTLDKKGREVVDQKTRNNISKRMLEYYKNIELLKYGSYLFEQKDYEGAYQAFKKHTDMPALAMMQNEKAQKEMPRDTLFWGYRLDAARLAIQSEHHEEAVAILNEMKDGDYKPILVNQFLYQEYVTLKDTAKFLETLETSILRYPQEPWFLQNLINYYIFSGQEQTALAYLAKAIEAEPNVAQYHYIKGNLDENQGNYDEALKDFDRALELDPTMADAMAGKGRVYYNQAVKLNEAAAMISDNKEYKKALEEMNAVFRQSLPYFEKAHEMDPQERSNMQILKGLYYRFNMDDKYQAISEELNNL